MSRSTRAVQETLMIVRTVVISTAALMLFTGCQKTETPATSAALEKPAAQAPAAPAECKDCIPVTVDIWGYN